ncbi:MAG TPA: fused MFS/spermidine synthase [Alphaproteobacteria bacterium]|nr:fused MFS/spermidine synthase [Alphaproteobacteria bacterium]
MILVEERTNEFGEVQILRGRADGSHAYASGSWYHSHADRNGVSLASYVHALYDLADQARAQSILLLGCAGGTLATMLARAGRQVTAVDIDPGCFALARKFFGLPAEVACHVGDGRAFLASSTASFDAVVVDAYHRHAVPSHLCSAEFFALARSRLAPHGMILVNAVLAHDLDRLADRLAAGMTVAGLPTRILDAAGTRDRNAIILGGTVGGLARPTLRVRPDTLANTLAAELAEMAFRTRRRAEPIHDAELAGQVVNREA